MVIVRLRAQKNVDFVVYVLSRYRQTPNTLYPSKSPRRTDVSILALLFGCLLYFGEISGDKIQADDYVYMSNSFVYAIGYSITLFKFRKFRKTDAVGFGCAAFHCFLNMIIRW